MKVVIAPDKFKGSLTAPEVAAAVERGLRAVAPDIQVTNVPVADGGEGTLQAAVGAGYTRHLATVAGPTGMPLEAAIAVKGQQAVIEMAAASGLDVLPGGRLQALTATSRGTGELISAALDLGCTSIILGVGGSACTDGGAGLLQGLGAILKDDGGRFLPRGGAALARLAEVDLSGLDPRLAGVSFVLASDVDNPLLGGNGAAAVFGPQKGASVEDVATLDAALAQFVRVLGPELGAGTAAMAHLPGSGAAGGVGFAALAVLEAQRRRGIDVVIELTGLRDKLAGADLVITGEGSLDTQSLEGKTPIGVATEAAAAGVPVFAVCGRTLLSDTQLESAGLAQTYALTDLESDVSVCMAEAGRLLERVGAEIGLRLLAGDIARGRELEAQRGA